VLKLAANLGAPANPVDKGTLLQTVEAVLRPQA